MKASDSMGPLTPNAALESQALHWAALLAARPELRKGNPQLARDQLLEWWTNSAEGLSENALAFPDAFVTTRFQSEVESVKGYMQRLMPVFHSLRTGEISLAEAMEQVARQFAWEEGRLLGWRRSLENLVGLTHWLPAFLHAQEYVRLAFPLGQENFDRLRESLLQSIFEPHRFLEANERRDFDARFLEFKKNYMEFYYSAHESALRILGGSQTNQPTMDSTALRNLELLSSLHYTDRSYLNRVKALAKWLQRKQCNLPIRQILERYPRCYCNFNPTYNRQPADSVAQINAVIQEGIGYFRTLLRKCRHLILEELKTQRLDDYYYKQIAALLGRGQMVPLKPQSIETLNKIIRKHSGDFLTAIRNYSRQTQDTE